MGYYTNYKVEVIKGNTDEIFEAIDKGNKKDDRYYGISDPAGYNENCKWYEHEEAMRDLSKQFPEALIKLSGEGEESGDIWEKYFKNGKMQVCSAKIIFEKFDEKKLK